MHYFQNPFLNENTDPSQTENKNEDNEVVTIDTIDCFEKSNKEYTKQTGIILLADQVAVVILMK